MSGITVLMPEKALQDRKHVGWVDSNNLRNQPISDDRFNKIFEGLDFQAIDLRKKALAKLIMLRHAKQNHAMETTTAPNMRSNFAACVMLYKNHTIPFFSTGDIKEDLSEIVKSKTRMFATSPNRVVNVLTKTKVDPLLNKNIERLESYKTLAANWNDNGAEPFDPKFIDEIKEIVTGLDKQPQIFPTGRNSIQLEYDKPTGDSIELEIYPGGLIEAVTFFQNGKTEEEDLTTNELNTLIQRFHAS